MVRLLVLLLLSAHFLQATPLQEVPIAHQGRIRPLDAYARALLPEKKSSALNTLWNSPQRENLPLLPCRNGQWLPLKVLRENTPNITAYPDALFSQLKKALSNPAQLAVLLDQGYSQIAGTPYVRSHSKTLYYPARWQLKLERLYFQYPLLPLCIFGYFLSFLLFVIRKEGRGLFLLTYVLHTLILLARCAILQRPPVSNMAETVLYVPWIAASVALLFRSRALMAGGAFCGLFLLSLLSMSSLSVDMEHVQPVLDSRMWLTVHVLMVVGSYGAFALSGILAHLYLLRPSPQLSKGILQTLYLGVSLLIPGTILGGVWAAQSWGRFWDWDPKESWAFISSCLYLICIHAYTFGHIRERGLAVGALVGLQAISFTWYGVNYILGTGLHSYGFGSGGEFYYLAFVALECLFLAATALKRKAFAPQA